MSDDDAGAAARAELRPHSKLSVARFSPSPPTPGKPPLAHHNAAWTSLPTVLWTQEGEEDFSYGMWDFS